MNNDLTAEILIRLFLGGGIIGWGISALRFYKQGIGLEFSRARLYLVPVHKATSLQKAYMLFQAVMLIACGIAIFFVKI